MNPDLNNILVDFRTKERFQDAENERLARELSRANAGPRRSWPRIPHIVRRRLGRPVPSV
jgi:hypothetical protein